MIGTISRETNKMSFAPLVLTATLRLAAYMKTDALKDANKRFATYTLMSTIAARRLAMQNEACN